VQPTTLIQLASAIRTAPPAVAAGLRLTSVSTDTRTLRPGAVFFAIRGENFDGSAFLEQAKAKGAAAAVVPHGAPDVNGLPLLRVPDVTRALLDFARDQRRRLGYTVVAITGSAGKTTTKDLLYAMLRDHRRTVRARKSFNNHVGVPLTLLEADAETEVVVLEVGTNSPGEIATLAAVAEPDVAVITCVAPAHLAGLGSIEGVAREKLSLLAHVRPRGVTILNQGDLRLRGAGSALRSVRGKDSVTFCGWHQADLTGSLGGGPDRWELGVRLPQGHQVTLPLCVPGREHALDALLALGAALRLGVTPAQAAAGLASFEPPQGRMNVLRVGEVTLVDDTYNANPASMGAALDTFATIADAGQRVVVLGAMKELGPSSANHHLAIGRQVARLGAAALVTVGEEARAIARGAREGGLAAELVHEVSDAAAAGQRVAELIHPGDAALFKASRSARLEQAVARVRSHLDASATSLARRVA
jgi:UDP-N-acetylmuramoyl-tripeptide--D-alanyl-D-alanine ligase